MYYEKARVYLVAGSIGYFEIGDGIIVAVSLGADGDQLAKAHKLAEMPVEFFFQFEN